MRIEKAELIDTVVDGGRTHFAINGDYAGSIDTYNNALTQAGAYILGKAVTITVNGEKVYANINSVREFMLKNQADDFRSLQELSYKDLSSYQFRVLPLYGEKRFMRGNISQYTKDILSKELFKAIATDNPSLAEKKIRQGAELNTHAWLNEDTGEFFFTKHFAPRLPERSLQPQRFIEATPFLLALRLNQFSVATLIFDQMGDRSLVGQTLVFRRELLDTKSHWNLMPTTRYETIEEKLEDGSKRTTIVAKPGFDVHTSQTNIFLDRYDERNLMVYNQMNGQLEYDPQASIHTQWDRNNLTGIIPVW